MNTETDLFSFLEGAAFLTNVYLGRRVAMVEMWTTETIKVTFGVPTDQIVRFVSVASCKQAAAVVAELADLMDYILTGEDAI